MSGPRPPKRFISLVMVYLEILSKRCWERQLCCEGEGLWTFSYSWKGHLTAKHQYLSEIAFMASPSLFPFLTSKWLKFWECEQSLSCVPAKKLLFSDLFSWVFLACTWTGHVAMLLRAGRCGRVSWIGCTGSWWLDQQELIPGRTCWRVPLFAKAVCQLFQYKQWNPHYKFGYSAGPMTWSWTHTSVQHRWHN